MSQWLVKGNHAVAAPTGSRRRRVCGLTGLLARRYRSRCCQPTRAGETRNEFDTVQAMTAQAIISWSSGKDAAYALHEVRRHGEYEIVAALTTLSIPYQRVSMHAVRDLLLDRQMSAVGLPCRKIYIPAPCPNEVYEREMAAALAEFRERGVDCVVFGDLFLESVRAYREERLAEVGMRGVFPLWGRPTRELAEEMITAGMRATITCIDPRKLPESYAGRSYDAGFVDDLPPDVDPCGENGEFHTLATAGPMFRDPIATSVGEVVRRDGFVFTDVLPVG